MANNTEAPAARPKYDIAEISIAVVSGLALAVVAVFLCVAPLAGKIAGGRDFLVYWATGQQLAHHANPYDRQAMARIEQGAGSDWGSTVLFMRNPPWGLPLALPLGWVGVRLGALLWSLVLLGCLAGSVRMLWRLHGRPPHLLSFLGYSFAPALVCLIGGQTSLFALLGLVLFLRLHEKRPFLAGMALGLCALKPHLFLAWGVVLLVWVVMRGAYRILAGGAASLALACAATYAIDPAAWSQYAGMMRTSGIETEFIPCLSVALRQWVSPQTMALQYLAPAVACVWALVYFWPRRQAWDWKTDGSLVMLVSLFSAPYCWVFDQALAIPALLFAAYTTRSRILLALLAAGTVGVLAAMMGGVGLPSPFFLWTSPAWLAWYLCARASAQGSRAGPSVTR